MTLDIWLPSSRLLWPARGEKLNMLVACSGAKAFTLYCGSKSLHGKRDHPMTGNSQSVVGVCLAQCPWSGHRCILLSRLGLGSWTYRSGNSPAVMGLDSGETVMAEVATPLFRAGWYARKPRSPPTAFQDHLFRVGLDASALSIYPASQSRQDANSEALVIPTADFYGHLSRPPMKSTTWRTRQTARLFSCKNSAADLCASTAGSRPS